MKFHISRKSQRTSTLTLKLNECHNPFIFINLLILSANTSKLHLPLVGNTSILHIQPTNQYTRTTRLPSQTTEQNKLLKRCSTELILASTTVTENKSSNSSITLIVLPDTNFSTRDFVSGKVQVMFSMILPTMWKSMRSRVLIPCVNSRL